MAIPGFTRGNVLAAIKRIRREGVPPRRKARRYHIVHEGRKYPPKYVVSLAVQDAKGHALDPQEFEGGVATNSRLRRLGFSVEPFDAEAADTGMPTVIPPKRPSTARTIRGASTEGNPTGPIWRVIVGGQPSDPVTGEAMLLHVLREQWPKGAHVKFLITPGGFVTAPFPENWHGGVGWDSRPTALVSLRERAERALSQTLTGRVLEAAQGKIDVLTIGIDLSSDDLQEHAELVAVWELATQRKFWTGKSYPTIGQERHLVQVVDLKTHLLEVADERVLVLGCHDLNMFSARAWANQNPGSVRRRRCKEMRRLARQFAPTVALQRPHSTDTPNIWRGAWTGVKRELPSVTAWASGIAYYNLWGQQPRASLQEVLAATRGPMPSRDFVVRPT